MFERDTDDEDEAARVMDQDVMAGALGSVCSGFGVLNSIGLMGLAQESAREPIRRFRND